MKQGIMMAKSIHRKVGGRDMHDASIPFLDKI